MSKLSIEIDNGVIKTWEQQLGKPYRNWSDEDKRNFLFYITSQQISVLDSYVDSLQVLSSLQQTPFGQKINELRSIGFEIVLNNDFKYVGFAGPNGTEAKEIVLFHPSGLLYYTTSIQEKRSLGRETDIKRSELYFQASSLKEDASLEGKILSQKGSSIQLKNGIVFKSYTDINIKDINIILESFEFVQNWESNHFFTLLNEEDVYQNVNGQIQLRPELDEISIHMHKIKQFPERVQSYLGYEEEKTFRK